MTRRFVLSAACLVLAGLTLGACHNDKSTSEGNGAAMSTYSKTCFCGHGAADSKYTSTYNGKTIGFCCSGCKAQWDKMSDADKAAQFAKMKPGS